MHLWRKNEKYAFIVFSYIVRLIFLNISRSGFKWFLVVLYLFFRKTVFFIVAIDEREANIFIVPVLMIFALSLAQYAWFVCGFPTDIFYDYAHDEFICRVCRYSLYRFDRARSLGHYDIVLR